MIMDDRESVDTSNDEVEGNPLSRYVFYSSRKLRIRTKCSRTEDALISNQEHLAAFKYPPREFRRNPTTLGKEILPSFRQELPGNRQLPFGLPADTFPRPSASSFASSLQSRNIDEFDETFSTSDVFYGSGDLRLHTNCSRRVDALISPRQNLIGSPKLVFYRSDVSSANTTQSDRSSLGYGQESDSASPPQSSHVRFEGIGSTSVKRRRSETPESGSSESRNGKESLVSTLPSLAATGSLSKPPIMRKARKTVTGAPKREGLAFRASLQLSSIKKRKVMESDDSNDANKPDSSFPISGDNCEYTSRFDLQTESGGNVCDEETDGVEGDEETDGDEGDAGDEENVGDEGDAGDEENVGDACDEENEVRKREGDGNSSGATGSNKRTSVGVSKDIFMAQCLLFTVLKELMKFDREVHTSREFARLFTEIHNYPSVTNVKERLKMDLLYYIAQRDTTMKVNDFCTTLLYDLQSRLTRIHDALIRIVITVLCCTVSVWSGLFDTIMINYKAFKILHEYYSHLLTPDDISNIQDDKARAMVAVLSEGIEKLVLPTRIAFQILLIHIGEYADPSVIDAINKEQLFEGDEKYLRCFE